MKTFSLAVRIITALTAAALLCWSCLNFITAGTFIGIALFGAIILVCIFWKPFSRLIKKIWSKTAGKAALSALGAVIAFLTGACVFFSVNMITSAEREISDPQAIIILGCQVRGETPSLMLARRLDAALEAHEKYPETIFVASGGKGSGENVSEAEAMRRYLEARGISGEKIITEDRSENTEENLRFSAEIMREKGINRAVIVTSEFHQYRASIYARREGLETGAHSAKTLPHNMLNYWLRELAAIFAAASRSKN